MEAKNKLIQYIGNKDKKIDTVTGSRPRLIWHKGEVLEVPIADANRLLQFPTVWREVQDEGMGISTVVEAEKDEDVQTIQLTDAEIQEMDEDQLRDLVRENGLKTRFQKHDTVEDMRQRVIKALEQEA